MRMTEAEFGEWKQRQEALGVKVSGTPAAVRTVPVTREEKAACVAVIANGEVPEFKGNKTEAAYMALLEARKRAGEILWYRFEGITLKLAQDTRYTPDFFVLAADGSLECHETKGPFMREDSWIKLKIATSLFPFRFIFAQKTKNEGWQIKEVSV